IQVVTMDGRVMLGELKGYDQLWNLVLGSCEERIFGPEGTESEAVGVHMLRGDSVALVSQIDPVRDQAIPWATLPGETLPPFK
ncbi:hypothetical protein CXG81DRAFT_15150, partial [Caulochytrium protostelioides]